MGGESLGNPEGMGNSEKRERGGSSRVHYPMKYIVLFKPKLEDPEAAVLAITNIIKTESGGKAWIILNGEEPKKNRSGWFQAAAVDEIGAGFLFGRFTVWGFEFVPERVDPDDWRKLQ